MRLSEMTTEQMADVLVKLAEPLEKIGKNDKFNGMIAEMGKINADGTLSRLQRNVIALSGWIRVLLDVCPDETFEIIAAMTGKTADEIRAQKAMQTIDDVRGFIDEDFVRFFTSSAAQGVMK